jgi:hypothetical protein
VSEELADVAGVGWSVFDVAADHIVAERVRDGAAEGLGGVLDDGIGVAEGEVIAGFVAFFFIVFLLFVVIVVTLVFVSHGSGDGRGLAVGLLSLSWQSLHMVSMFSSLSRSPALVSFSSSAVSHSISLGWVMGMLGILAGSGCWGAWLES